MNYKETMSFYTPQQPTKRLNPYATHLPLLLSAVARTTGPILELGTGLSSTFILHEICKVMDRRLVSLESDKDWYKKFTQLKSNTHELYLIDKYEDCQLIDEEWDVVLIDHAPAGRRKEDLKRVKNAQYIILHDTEPRSEIHYHLDEPMNKFKYRFDFNKYDLWATIVSNHHDLSNIV